MDIRMKNTGRRFSGKTKTCFKKKGVVNCILNAAEKLRGMSEKSPVRRWEIVALLDECNFGGVEEQKPA